MTQASSNSLNGVFIVSKTDRQINNKPTVAQIKQDPTERILVISTQKLTNKQTSTLGLQCKSTEVIPLRNLKGREGVASCSNISSSIDAGLCESTRKYDFSNILKTKFDRALTTLYFLLSVPYKTNCPTLLGKTEHQNVVGYDEMQGLHSCLTPNAFLHCDRKSLRRALCQLIDSFTEVNRKHVNELLSRNQQELKKLDPSICERIKFSFEFVLFNLHLPDLLCLLDESSKNVQALALNIKNYCDLLNQLRGLYRSELLVSKPIKSIGDFLAQSVVQVLLKKISDALFCVCTHYRDGIGEEHFAIKEGESLLQNTHLYLEMNAGDVLPEIANVYDGYIIEDLFRWKQIYQMNRSAGGRQTPDSLYSEMKAQISEVITRSAEYVDSKLVTLEEFGNLEKSLREIKEKLINACKLFNPKDPQTIVNMQKQFLEYVEVIVRLQKKSFQENSKLDTEEASLRDVVKKVDSEDPTLGMGQANAYLQKVSSQSLPKLKNVSLQIPQVNIYLEDRMKDLINDLNCIIKVLKMVNPSSLKGQEGAKVFWKELTEAENLSRAVSIRFLKVQSIDEWKKTAEFLLNQIPLNEYLMELNKRTTPSAILSEFKRGIEGNDPHQVVKFLSDVCDYYKREFKGVSGTIERQLFDLLASSIVDLQKTDSAKLLKEIPVPKNTVFTLFDPNLKILELPNIKEGMIDEEILVQLARLKEKDLVGDKFIFTAMEVVDKVTQSLQKKPVLVDEYNNVIALLDALKLAYMCYQAINKMAGGRSILSPEEIAKFMKNVFGKLNFDSIKKGSFFMTLSQELFPKASCFYFDFKKCTGFPVGSTITQPKASAPYLKLQLAFLSACSAPSALIGILKSRKDAWISCLENIRDSSENSKSLSKLDQLLIGLSFLKEQVVPSYIAVLKESESDKEVPLDTLIKEYNHQGILGEFEVKIFHRNLKAIPDISHQWFLPTVLSRQVEVTSSQQEPLLLHGVKRDLLSKTETFRFDILMKPVDASKTTRICEISLRKSQDNIPNLPKAEEIKIVEGVYRDVQKYAENLNPMIPHELNAIVTVHPFTKIAPQKQ